MVKRTIRSLKPARSEPTAPLHHRLKLMARHPFAVPVVTIAGLLIVTGVLLAVFNRPSEQPSNPNIVVVSHDGEQQTVSSKEPTVGDLLKKLQIRVGDGDIVEPAVSTQIQQDDFRVNVYRAKPVVIIDGGSTDYTFSAASTARSVARQAGLKVFAEDQIETRPVTNFVANAAIGEELIIKRSTAIDLNLFGAPLQTRTLTTNVRALLAEKNVKLQKNDIVRPSLDAPITPGVQVAVIRNGLTTRTLIEDIPTPTQNITDNSLSYGVSAVRQQGSPGKRAVTYQINTQNGIEIGRTAIQTVVTLEPVTQITVVGSNLSGIKGDMALAGISPADYTYVDYIVTKESRWNPAARNASGAFGLCQALPGSKMASAGADWETNPVTQLRWCNGYATSRYGSWYAAYNYWMAHHYW